MKKLLICLVSLLLVLSVFGCSSKKAETTDDKVIKISATLEPHATILEKAKELLAAQGYTLEIIVLDDYYVFNKALNAGEVDANYFQHLPFFESDCADNGYDLVNVAGVHIEPFGFYSKTLKPANGTLTLEEVPENAKVIISNSVADHGRILSILANAGIIKLAEGVNSQNATINDIVENPKNIQFVEVKPELLTVSFDNGEGDLVAINGNYAIQAGLNPTKDAVILEQADTTNPYVNIIAVKNGTQDSAKIKALVEVMKSEEIKQFILDTYSDGSVIPAE